MARCSLVCRDPGRRTVDYTATVGRGRQRFEMTSITPLPLIIPNLCCALGAS
jgi:hypothetical protein